MEKVLFGIVWILFGDLVIGIGGAVECGHPGSPLGGRPSPLRGSYAPGERVSFTCDPGHALLHGDPHRTCGRDGRWRGQMPLCDRGLPALSLSASSRSTLTLYPAERAVDGDPASCAYTEKGRPRWIRVDMGRDRRVRAVDLTVPAGIYTHDAAQLTVYAISVRDSTTAAYHKCAAFSGRFASSTLRLSCAGGGVEGRYIHVEDNRGRVDYFSLCEIQVFVHKDRYECGEGERPAHAHVERTAAGAVKYRCLHGWRLEGPAARVCTDGGRWEPELQPVCTEITCPALPPPSRAGGRWVAAGGGRGLGASANLTCDFGYESTAGTIVCGGDGRWTPDITTRLSCQPVQCGPPPARHQSDRFVLLNGTRYGAVALHSCSAPSTSQANQEEILYCREDGQWSKPKIDCAPPQQESGFSRLGLIEEEQGDVPIGVVIGMSVVVFVLLLVVILVLLLKRRKVLYRNSDALPGKDKESTSAPPEQPSSFDNDAFYATIPHPPENPRPLFSTVVFPNHWRRKKSGSSSKDSGHSSSSGGQIYEEVGGVNNTKGESELTIQEGMPRAEAVYAQVDLDDKRRSRMNKTLQVEQFKPVDPPQWEGAYRCEGGAVYDEVDLEPIKLRELPPIPGGEEEGVTYASLALPLDPPNMTGNALYHSSVTTPVLHPLPHLKENALYHASDSLKV